jgi:hypothetical protein
MFYSLPGVPPEGNILAFTIEGHVIAVQTDIDKSGFLGSVVGICNRSAVPRLWGSKGRAASKRTWNKDGQQNGFSVNSSKHSESREVAAQRPRVMDLGWALRHGINQKLFALWRSLAHGNEAFWTRPGKGTSHEAFEHGVTLHRCSHGLGSREIDRQTTDWTEES